MEVKNYKLLEQNIESLFKDLKERKESFVYKGKEYFVEMVGKPYPQKGGGECKTDLYVLCSDIKSNKKEFKISIKDYSSSYVGSYINEETAQCIFGNEWNNILEKATCSLMNKFINKNLIYTEGRLKESITIGWRLDIELSKKTNRELSYPLDVHENIIKNALYKGLYQDEDKRNAIVDGKIVKNSGVANYIIYTSISVFKNINELLSESYSIDNMPIKKTRMAFKALNYRLDRKKSSNGYRPLAVSIDWEVEENKLVPIYIFNKPLLNNGKDVVEKLKCFFEKNNIESINNENFIKLIHNENGE